MNTELTPRRARLTAMAVRTLTRFAVVYVSLTVEEIDSALND